VSFISMIQEVCGRIGIVKPNAVISNTDPQIIQLASIANGEGQDLARRYAWQILQKETSFTTVATQVQGAIGTIAPGYRYIINDTIWNRSLRRPVFGPNSPQTWQQQKAFNINGPWNQFRIQNDNINFFPTPTAGQSCFFEYISKYWCTSQDGSASRTSWLADSDVGLLDEEIMQLGIIWRWKQTKGLQYAEDMASYERFVADATARDGGKQRLNLAGSTHDLYPAILVPAGSWPL
jgi:hypothetical protein